LEGRTYLLLRPVIINWREWASCRDHSPAIRPLGDILWLRLVQPGRIAKGEYNRAVDVPCHLADDFLSEGTGLSRGADENMWFHALDHGEQIDLFVVRPFAVFSREVFLARGEFVFLGF